MVERSDTVPAENVYVAHHAPVEKLAELVQLLYPGKGPGGSDRVQFIVYADAGVWGSAKRFAELLDHAGSVESSLGQLWPDALGRLYKSNFPRKLDRQDRTLVMNMFNRIAGGQSSDPDLRWGSGVIMAHLAARYDPKDYTTASAALALADKVVRRGGYREMVIRYHRIRHLIARGRRVKAVQARAIAKAREALDAYHAFRNTSCYQMIRTISRR